MSADFVQYDLGSLNAGAVVEITLKNRANVHLVDSHNFDRYRQGEDFRYVGGEAVVSPLRLQVPTTGHWYIVIDLGGGAGTIESVVRVLAVA